ncbi:hypothetical protein ASPBRDRAFT_53270 [Aspergillus brasiliensis CBS 101740]|uniref:SRR1-like domain-containing protein n=1 Tax=Aspergillus brasiliensis (strain CBS 101740 / IMI 381727 / IBT 21946) TaxID=767769 RepID=A0A1L9UUV5_ASPBC|nr:hypothetical protein ASPBRDRAFT_53270 [Aspergillus brasiliensis CBS 101740]
MQGAARPVCVVVGLATRTDPPPLPPAEKILSHIQEIYDSGRPFFTKELLLNIKQFPVLTGQVSPASEPDMEYSIQKPCITYSSLQGLFRICDMGRGYLAYNHVRIGHYKFLRNIHTKELYSDRSVESLRIWENTAECQDLQAMLVSRKTARIIKIVGLALGSSATVHPRLQFRSAFQHALLLTLCDIYCNMQGVAPDAIPCFAQDPACNDIDVSAVAAAGIKIVDDPVGFLGIDDPTVVVSCAPNIAVRQIVFDLARPAVLIRNRVKDEDDGNMTDPFSPRVRTYIQGFYDEFGFRDYNNRFGDLAVYIRRN